MKLSRFWTPADSQQDLLEENKMLRGLIAETLAEVEATHTVVEDFIDRLDSILKSVKKISDGTE
jgi:hypothetical protein